MCGGRIVFTQTVNNSAMVVNGKQIHGPTFFYRCDVCRQKYELDTDMHENHTTEFKN